MCNMLWKRRGREDLCYLVRLCVGWAFPANFCQSIFVAFEELPASGVLSQFAATLPPQPVRVPISLKLPFDTWGMRHSLLNR